MGWHKSDNLSAPDMPGLYAIFDRATIIYLGKSTSIRRRLRTHALGAAIRAGMFKGVSVCCVSVKYKHVPCQKKMSEMEKKLIDKLKPSANIAGSKPSPRPKIASVSRRLLAMAALVKWAGGRKQLCEKLGVSAGYLSLLCSGKRKVPADMAWRIESITKGEFNWAQFWSPVTRKRRK